MRKRASIWSARLLCSNPAGTMIWPFVSGKTPASRQCATWRSRHGRWETSGARYPSLTGAALGVADGRHLGQVLNRACLSDAAIFGRVLVLRLRRRDGLVAEGSHLAC